MSRTFRNSRHAVYDISETYDPTIMTYRPSTEKERMRILHRMFSDTLTKGSNAPKEFRKQLVKNVRRDNKQILNKEISFDEDHLYVPNLKTANWEWF